MKTYLFLGLLLLSFNASAQLSKWSLGVSASLSNEDNGFNGPDVNHVQTSYSIELIYDISNRWSVGTRHLFARDRPPFDRPYYMDLSGVFVQAGFGEHKLRGYLEAGYFIKTNLLSERFIRDSRINNSENIHGYEFGGGIGYLLFKKLTLGFGGNIYIPFARLRNRDIGAFPTPKLELLYRFLRPYSSVKMT